MTITDGDVSEVVAKVTAERCCHMAIPKETNRLQQSIPDKLTVQKTLRLWKN